MSKNLFFNIYKAIDFDVGDLKSRLNRIVDIDSLKRYSVFPYGGFIRDSIQSDAESRNIPAKDLDLMSFGGLESYKDYLINEGWKLKKNEETPRDYPNLIASRCLVFHKSGFKIDLMEPSDPFLITGKTTDLNVNSILYIPEADHFVSDLPSDSIKEAYNQKTLKPVGLNAEFCPIKKQKQYTKKLLRHFQNGWKFEPFDFVYCFERNVFIKLLFKVGGQQAMKRVFTRHLTHKSVEIREAANEGLKSNWMYSQKRYLGHLIDHLKVAGF